MFLSHSIFRATKKIYFHYLEIETTEETNEGLF